MVRVVLIFVKFSKSEETKAIIEEIDEKLLAIAMKIMRGREDYKETMNMLEQGFRPSSATSAKQVVIRWYIVLFEKLSEELLANEQNDIFAQLIDNLKFEEAELSKSILQLLCMLSMKEEKYLRLTILKLVQKF